MESPEAVVLLELKYCERCGGLWVRRLCSEEVYCETCAIEMAEVALPRKKKTARHLPGKPGGESRAAGPRLVLSCGQGGNS